MRNSINIISTLRAPYLGKITPLIISIECSIEAHRLGIASTILKHNPLQPSHIHSHVVFKMVPFWRWSAVTRLVLTLQATNGYISSSIVVCLGFLRAFRLFKSQKAPGSQKSRSFLLTVFGEQNPGATTGFILMASSRIARYAPRMLLMAFRRSDCVRSTADVLGRIWTRTSQSRSVMQAVSAHCSPR